MPDMIRDGTGSGQLAKVDDTNRLCTSSNTIDNGSFINVSQGGMYSIISAVTPAGAGNCFLYIQNAKTGYDLVIGRMTLLSSSTEIIDVKRVTGTPAGGTVNVPVNRNLNYTNSAIGTFLTGTNITGLTATDTLVRFFSTATIPVVYDVYFGLIIPPNISIGFYATNGSIPINYSLVLYYCKSGSII
jgi:hypothetical protein